MNITAEIKSKDGAFIRVMSVTKNPAVGDRVIIATKDFEFEVNAAELVAAIQACCLQPTFGHIVRTGQLTQSYAGAEAEAYLKGASMRGAPWEGR